MATFASSSFLSTSHLPPDPSRRRFASSYLSSSLLRSTTVRRPPKTLVLASSTSSFDDFNYKYQNSSSKKSVISDLIQEIEPLDVSLIQKDVSFTTVDAMKRTISGMLGLLPSDQFQVLIEALWEPLSKLLISSMMTGYTLRNAEYRLCLERNLDICEGNMDKHKLPDKNNRINRSSGEDELPRYDEISDKISDIPGLKELTPEAQQYVIKLRLRLASAKKELGEVKRKKAALEMQQFVGEEKNDLLDYLRSLQPEKVAELSEPSSPELKEVMCSVVHGLLATLSPKMHSMAPPHMNSNNTVNTGIEEKVKEEHFDVVENTSLNFHPLVSLSRDYLARLLFWCMLLGHYLRGLEYRMELMELLSLSNDAKSDGQQSA